MDRSESSFEKLGSLSVILNILTATEHINGGKSINWFFIEIN